MKKNKFKFSGIKDIDSQLTKLANDFNYFILKTNPKKLNHLLKQMIEFRSTLAENSSTKHLENKFEWVDKFDRMEKEIHQRLEKLNA